MNPDNEDRVIVKVLALAAAAIVNAGNGAPPAGVLAQAAEYETFLTDAFSEPTADGA